MDKTYYGENKHLYMENAPKFAEFIFRKIRPTLKNNNYDCAIEIGAGLGRFTPPLVQHFKNVILIEPNQYYAEQLEKTYRKYPKVNIVCADAKTALAGLDKTLRYNVFCFHVLHHLKLEEREHIYEFVHSTNSYGVACEPNPYNLFIPLQILITPEMTFKEEKEYLKLTHRFLKKEIENSNLQIEKYTRIASLPPFLAKKLLAFGLLHIVNLFEMLFHRTLVLPSYILIAFKKHEN